MGGERSGAEQLSKENTGSGGLHVCMRHTWRPRAKVEVLQGAHESRGRCLRSVFHLGTPGSFPSPGRRATRSSAPAAPPHVAVSQAEPRVPRWACSLGFPFAVFYLLLGAVSHGRPWGIVRRELLSSLEYTQTLFCSPLPPSFSLPDSLTHCSEFLPRELCFFKNF